MTSMTKFAPYVSLRDSSHDAGSAHRRTLTRTTRTLSTVMRSIVRRAAGSAVVVALLSVPAVLAQTPATVTVRDFAFQPRDLTVPPGATVRWTNQDGTPHQVESDDGTVVGTVMGTGEIF